MAVTLGVGLAAGVGLVEGFAGEAAGAGAAKFDGETVGTGDGDGDGLDVPCVAPLSAGGLLSLDCAKTVSEAMQITPRSRNTFFISNVNLGSRGIDSVGCGRFIAFSLVEFSVKLLAGN